MTSRIGDFFSVDYMPHGHCYLWKPEILWLNVISDALIASAYFTIPFVLYLFVKKREDLKFGWIFHLFSAFIFLCGVTHLFGIYTVWQGAYGYHGLAKLVTAIVSVSTAYALISLLPKALALPGPADYAREKERAYRAELEKLALENEKEKMQTVRMAVEGSPFGKLVTDARGEIVLTNSALCELFGYQEKELLGQHVNMLLPPELRDGHRQQVAEITQGQRSAGLMTSRLVYGQARDGGKIPVEVTLHRGELNGKIKVFATVVDISERLNYESRLLEANARFERVLSGARDAPWEWNVRQDSNWFSPRFHELLGWPGDIPKRLDTWLAHIHPEHRQRVEQHLQDHLRGNSKYDINYLGLAADGTYHWFNTRGGSVRDEQGEVVLMSGVISDVQEEKEMEAALLDKSEFLESVFTGSSGGILVFDKKDRELVVSAANERFSQLLGCQRSEIEGLKLSTLLERGYDGALSKLSSHIDQLASTDTGRTHSLIHEDPSHSWVQLDIHPLQDDSGQIDRIIISSSDVTELKLAEQRLENTLQEKVSLLNEVHHRVKNNLQIVSSLMDIQSRQVKAEDVALMNDLKNRVRAMALIHELLYQTDDLASVNLETYVGKLVSLIGDTLYQGQGDAMNCQLITPPQAIQVSINRMVPLGLLICEAVTNAFKYAFQEGQGRLEVNLSRQEQKICISIRDNGPGFDIRLFEQASLSRHLGFTLMKTFAKQAGFDIKLSVEQGTRIDLIERP
ncbi:PAS domain S-box protein [Bowmanella dokdonensis]|uniref:histidine kinase n=1 Tax=Bowmanella dokdonensis TaxID=751969 RepID=A0A939IQB7_9ALTE|nr:PAS domain S-box protein [Bowmanella dokdonensis]MBN7824864.1 PAS domain S-box protein [Bowmanella dokdonensis]